MFHDIRVNGFNRLNQPRTINQESNLSIRKHSAVSSFVYTFRNKSCIKNLLVFLKSLLNSRTVDVNTASYNIIIKTN